ncbi:hypothetical protein X744_19300 [Mesorhizobium sp. LNJC372A00]|nr:hypothetical protein X745_11895 [Mesorhizobium sp. LNJC374B00]ESY57248.1 hypothetical protein X744_19300 [Mesorhizobium sp. LNJC372A00]
MLNGSLSRNQADTGQSVVGPKADVRDIGKYDSVKWDFHTETIDAWIGVWQVTLEYCFHDRMLITELDPDAT